MIRASAFVGVLVLLVGGCGSDAFEAGVGDDRRVDELSDEEVQDVCERLDEFIRQDVLPPEDVQLAVCTAGGIVAENTFDGVTCEESVNDCTAEPPDGGDVEGFDCSAITTDTVSTCEATVGELERCINEIASNVDQTFASLDCSIADDPEWQTRLEEIGARLESPSCAELDDDCPFANFGATVEP